MFLEELLPDLFESQNLPLVPWGAPMYKITDATVPPGGGVGCQGCGAEPEWEALVHHLGCEDPEAKPNLDEDGNFVWRGCETCYADWVHELQGVLRQMDPFLPLACRGCGHPIATIEDILLRVRRI